MHWKKRFPEMRRCFEVCQNMCQEVVWVGECGVTLFVVGSSITVGGCGSFIIEDDNFVDAEDGESASDGAAEGGFGVV